MGFNGPVALNDKAIFSIMKNHFKVKKKYRIKLSKEVKSLFTMIQKIRSERE